jgi:hypothetical protein
VLNREQVVINVWVLTIKGPLLISAYGRSAWCSRGMTPIMHRVLHNYVGSWNCL